MQTIDWKNQIEDLCLKHKIDCHIIPECNPLAWPTLRRVHIRPLNTLEDFLTALHEIGHVVCRHLPEQSREYKEWMAWKWVQSQTNEWTHEMELHRKFCLRTWDLNTVYFHVPCIFDHNSACVDPLA